MSWGGQLRRAGATRRDAADQHAQVTLALAYLHGQIGDVYGLADAGQGADTAPQIIVQARWFGVGTEGVALYHPQIGAAVVEQYAGVVDHATVDPGHHQGHTDQQTQPHAGKDEFAPAVQDVAAGQADHGRSAAVSCATGRRRLPGRRALAL